MKRSIIMKSNISVQQRTRPEGRLFPRRKVASKSLLLNGGGGGDFDMELSLAIQESLKYAQQETNNDQEDNESLDSNDFCKEENGDVSQDEKQTRTVNKTDSAVPIMASCSAKDRTEEVSRLKELVLTQAELIQCQQEEIKKKDKDILDLMAGKDALECRLERMERRLSNMKQKEETQDGDGPTLKDGVVPFSKVNGTCQPYIGQKGRCDSPNQELKKKKRPKNMNFTRKKQRKWKMIESTQSVGTASEKEETEEDEDDSDEDNEEDEEMEEEEQSNVDESSEEKENKAVDASSSSESEEKMITYPILQTETLYHLYYPKHVLRDIDTSAVPEKPTQFEKPVETPSWRLKPLTNMYQLEGTENITDEAYHKRHQKFELEEKRRKRWDMQRMRELRVFEKLQKQKDVEARASQDEMDIETFLPSVHDLKHIEVTEFIPVMAFGRPVPYVHPMEFEIPWEMPSSVSASASRQKTNGTHSKRH